MKTRNVKKSSFIKGIAYSKGVLAVSMVSGNVYYYGDVPKDVAARFVKANSYGKYYNANIAGQYEVINKAEKIA